MSYSCCRPPTVVISTKPVNTTTFISPSGGGGASIGAQSIRPSTCDLRLTTNSRVCRASMVDSYESSSNFAKRAERAWLISQQPRPIACSSCESNGHVECQWCGGTGFFIIGDNMLCQVPSRNTSCVICAGK